MLNTPDYITVQKEPVARTKKEIKKVLSNALKEERVKEYAWIPNQNSTPRIYGLPKILTDVIGKEIRRSTTLDLEYFPISKIPKYQCNYKDPSSTPTVGVYKLICVDCPSEYFGETGRDLLTRAAEHNIDIRNANTKESAVAEHVWNNNHRIDTNKIILVEPERKIFNHGQFNNITSVIFYILFALVVGNCCWKLWKKYKARTGPGHEASILWKRSPTERRNSLPQVPITNIGKIIPSATPPPLGIEAPCQRWTMATNNPFMNMAIPLNDIPLTHLHEDHQDENLAVVPLTLMNKDPGSNSIDSQNDSDSELGQIIVN
ncbi:unnamed protein product [Orchesella dallaii]|uniref:GIY-YIG domain-containing protein n=1 Tax=Orchesella dallaii TaxID=48710 RepID=A0ABP1RRS0_9HEXA